MAKKEYIKVDKVYDIMGLGNTNFVGWKLTGANSIHKDDKNSYHICVRKDKFDFKEVGTLISYQAYQQFKDICENAPETFKKGKFKLNKNGTLPKELLSLLGTNNICKEISGVRNLAEVKATMDSWSPN